jgi:hypothetical protein
MPPAGFTEQMLLLERLIKTVVAAESVGSSVENGRSKMCFDCSNAKNIFWGQWEKHGETMRWFRKSLGHL